MSTLLNTKWSTNRERGVQKFGKLVYVDCERPLRAVKSYQVEPIFLVLPKFDRPQRDLFLNYAFLAKLAKVDIFFYLIKLQFKS